VSESSAKNSGLKEFILIDDSYVLITPVYNEEAHIGRTIQSVLEQTRAPKMWVIVNDGSTDRSVAIIQDYAANFDSIRLVERRREEAGHDFAARVTAINFGSTSLKDVEYSYIGILDSDISLPNDYYEKMLQKFRANPRLGIAAGSIFEIHKGHFQPRKNNREFHPAGAAQFFTRDCYQAVGGLQPFRGGYDDTVATVKARMQGWDTFTFSDLPVYHHRLTGVTGRSPLVAKFMDGLTEYSLGYHPLYEIGNCITRATDKPYLLGAVVKFSGFLSARFTSRKGHVPEGFREYLRREQMARLRTTFKDSWSGCIDRLDIDSQRRIGGS
jgi:biofilm PGA synthesis N-glycosyltransferase PgaC